MHVYHRHSLNKRACRCSPRRKKGKMPICMCGMFCNVRTATVSAKLQHNLTSMLCSDDSKRQ